ITPVDRSGVDAGLEVEAVTMRFGGLTAIADVSIHLQPGLITALIGPNGSGKSTLINVISGIYAPSVGNVRFFGRDITGMEDHRIAELGLVRTFQDPRLVPSFTVRENLLLGAHCRLRQSGVAAALNLPSAIAEEAERLRQVNAVIALAGIGDVADRTMESLPYGYRRLVEVGRTLL